MWTTPIPAAPPHSAVLVATGPPLFIESFKLAFKPGRLVERRVGANAARRLAAPPKLVTLNNALVAVMNPRGIAYPLTDPARFGAWVENAGLAHAWNAGQRVSYWREGAARGGRRARGLAVGLGPSR